MASRESFVAQPLGYVQGIALSVGRSRNMNIYSKDECQNVARKLVDAPMFWEHINARYSIGKVLESSFDGFNVHYKAVIYDEEAWNMVQTGTISKVSIGFNYEYSDEVDGHLLHNLDNLELSLVALSGVPNASIAPVKGEHLLEPFRIGEHVGVEQNQKVESMDDVSMREIVENTKKKAAAAAIAQKDAAIEAQIRAKIEAENAAKNSAAAAASATLTTEPEQLTPRQIIHDEVQKQLTAVIIETNRQIQKRQAEKEKEQ
ncbi:hypothetical protein MUO83_02415 [Candidatus Bathyarchaeota archaeon]|nr:hypothetical protein [Candidatus Bathyarchaeota archaeon]